MLLYTCEKESLDLCYAYKITIMHIVYFTKVIMIKSIYTILVLYIGGYIINILSCSHEHEKSFIFFEIRQKVILGSLEIQH